MALVIDTGPLLAAHDRRDRDYRACRSMLFNTSEPLVVPGPVLVEFEYLATRRINRGVFPAFLRDVAAGGYRIEDLRPPDYDRVSEILERYADAAIGFVDAAVLAVVERLGEPKLATLDYRHFDLLQPQHVPALELLPDRASLDS